MSWQSPGQKSNPGFLDQETVFQISMNCHFSMFQEHTGT